MFQIRSMLQNDTMAIIYIKKKLLLYIHLLSLIIQTNFLIVGIRILSMFIYTIPLITEYSLEHILKLTPGCQGYFSNHDRCVSAATRLFSVAL